MSNIGKVQVENLPISFKRFVVARFVNKAFWYYTSWKTLEEATTAAEEFDNAIVIEMKEYNE